METFAIIAGFILLIAFFYYHYSSDDESPSSGHMLSCPAPECPDEEIIDWVDEHTAQEVQTYYNTVKGSGKYFSDNCYKAIQDKIRTGSVPEKFKKKDKNVIDYSLYRNNYGAGKEDYSHLSASEARREMREAKRNGLWLSDAEYRGLMDAIASEKDEQYLSQIKEMTPEKTEKWFWAKRNRNIGMSSKVWQAVGEKLAPSHEAELLKELDKVTIGRIDGWVRSRKSSGYFFSDKVYEKALKIRKGEIENRKHPPKKDK